MKEAVANGTRSKIIEETSNISMAVDAKAVLVQGRFLPLLPAQA
jgi:hypothetical protein